MQMRGAWPACSPGSFSAGGSGALEGAPAFSLTRADPPDAAASPAGASLSCRALDAVSEAGQPATAEAAEHGQPLRTA